MLILAAICASLVIPFAASSGEMIWDHTRFATLSTLRSPHDAQLHFEIGNYFFGTGSYDTEKAMLYYGRALELDPDLPGVHYQRARIHFIENRLYDALQEINIEIEAFPENTRSYYVRGLIHGYSDRLKSAAQDFETFLASNPESWAAYNDLAWIQFQRGEYAAAVETAQKGLLRMPGNPWLLNSLGVAQLNLGHKEEARDAFTTALRVVETMTQEDWGVAYPGNDPAIYAEGLEKMELSLKQNLLLTNNVDSAKLQ